MLLSRDEMAFDFGGARLDPQQDRTILQWMTNQFLYGEMTGIQVGHWIYGAPDLESARFLSRQAIEEFQHVQSYLTIMKNLGLKPEPPSSVVRFLATGMMADSWEEHVAMEMATGEGFVAMAMYALCDTLDDPDSVAILERAARQEERHIEFGEQQTMKAVQGRPALARRLLGLNLVWRWGVKRIAAFIETKLPKEHPVLCQVRPFLVKALDMNELRWRRMGLLERPLSELSSAAQGALIAEAYGLKTAALVASPLKLLPFVGKRRRLTDTYLDDPAIRALMAQRP